jgi:FkbM family methyltransferase
MINAKVVFLKIRNRLIHPILDAQAKLKLHEATLKVEENYTFILPDGSLFSYPINSSIGYSLSRGGFEISEVDFVRRTLKKGDVVIDIGANGGFYTLIAAKIVGIEGHVYSCEPGARELELLKNNIKINNLKNVTVIESAIGNKEGITEFAIAEDGALNSLLKNDHPSQQIDHWQTVEINTIDNLVKQLNIEKVNFMKIDVEGAEKMVLEGAKKLMNLNDKITIMFEALELTSNVYGYKPLELIDIFMDAGFRVQYFNRFGKEVDISPSNKRIKKNIHNFVAYK